MKASQDTDRARKAFSFFMSLLLTLALLPVFSSSAHADEGVDTGLSDAQKSEVDRDGVAIADGSDPAAPETVLPSEEPAVKAVEPIAAASNDAEVTGGSAITASGTYAIADGATGVITIADNLEVTLVGNGIAKGAEFKNLSIEVGNASKLTLRDVFIEMSDSTPLNAVDFNGVGTLCIEGTNLLDKPSGYGNSAVVHVGPTDDVTLEGSGVLYGYKHAEGAMIGCNGGEVNGAITFKSGTWLLKGSKTGPLIGSDVNGTAGGDITIEGGELYLKVVAQGAALGCSRTGTPGNVIMTGGLVEIWADFSGSAIGYGGGNKTGAIGNFTVTGGSLKTVAGPNSLTQWGFAAGVTPIVTDKVISIDERNGADKETAILTFDASAYAGQESITVNIDGVDFYTGGLYRFVHDEQKNPTSQYTPDGWLKNSAESAVLEADKNQMYKNGSSFVPENNLYFHVSQEAHVVTVGDTVYHYQWDSANGSFVLDDRSVDGAVWNGNIDVSWYNTTDTEFTLTKPAQLAGLAAIVAGSYDDGAHVAGNAEYIAEASSYHYGLDTFKGKTIYLGADLDMGGVYDEATGTWSGPLYMPIGGQYVMHTSSGDITLGASFCGTFDGRGHTVFNINANRGTGMDLQSVGLIGRLGVHDNDPADMVPDSPTVRNVIVDGYIKGGRSIGGIVGKIGKTGTGAVIERCVNKATVISSDKKGVGGICGAAWNKGRISDCYNTGNIAGGSPAGGIAGSNEIVITNCYSTGAVSSARGDNFAMAMGTCDANGSFDHCYWLDGSAPGGGIFGSNHTDSAAKTATELQAGDMIALLGDQYVADTAGINNGYPVLKWQVERERTVTEISGETRIETAAAAAHAAYPNGSEGVIVATADGYADALAASSLAGALDYPILLTNGDFLNETVAQTVKDLGVKNVVVVGGAPSVSSASYVMLAAMTSGSSIRLAGADRIGTQEAIYAYGKERDFWKGDPIIATAFGYADALSMSAFAAKTASPLFLMAGDGTITAGNQNALMNDYAGKQAIILGGEPTLSSFDAKLIAGATGVEPLRLAGGYGNAFPKDRYGTSTAIAQFCIENGMSVDSLGFATGRDFPDALVAAPLLAKTNSFVVLADQVDVAESGLAAVHHLQTAASDELDGTYRVLFFGQDTGHLSADFRTTLLAALYGN